MRRRQWQQERDRYNSVPLAHQNKLCNTGKCLFGAHTTRTCLER
jgi:hypothetical protein